MFQKNAILALYKLRNILNVKVMSIDDDKKRALKEGMNGFVSKPIDIDELLNAINEFIR